MQKPQPRWIAVALTVACIGSTAGCLKPTLQFVPTTLSMRRSLAIPDTYPLGSVPRAHYHQMETNGEAVDFVINRHEFIRSTAGSTPGASTT